MLINWLEIFSIIDCKGNMTLGERQYDPYNTVGYEKLCYV